MESLDVVDLRYPELMITRARPLFVRDDLEWPSSLAQVAADRVRSQLHIETGDWLH
jgi:hypothetical protein